MPADTPPRPTHCLFVINPKAAHVAYAIFYPARLGKHYATGTVQYRPLDTRVAVEDRVRQAVRDRHPQYAEWAAVMGAWEFASDALLQLHKQTHRDSDLGRAIAHELLARGDAPWTQHQRVDHGTGSDFWCDCTCGMFAWLGTYHGDRGRRAAGRRAWQDHYDRRALDEALAAGDQEAYAAALATLDRDQAAAAG